MPERHHVGWKRPRYSGSTTYPGHQEDDPSIRYPGKPDPLKQSTLHSSATRCQALLAYLGSGKADRYCCISPL
jgi:hypothetical protein